MRDGTIRQNLDWLVSVFRWAGAYKVGGRSLLSGNPLHGVRLPEEKNVRRPVASRARFEETLAACPSADSKGRLACMLVIARYTGRRVNAICQLRGRDVLLTQDAVRRALASAGQDERLADYMPHGALRWRAEHDKLGYGDIAPIAPAVRSTLERYLRTRPSARLRLRPGTQEGSGFIASGFRPLGTAQRLGALPEIATAGGRRALTSIRFNGCFGNLDEIIGSRSIGLHNTR